MFIKETLHCRRHQPYFSFEQEDAHYYFGILRGFDTSFHILRSRLRDPGEVRLEVLDLPSLGTDRLRLLAVSAQLALEFKRAKTDWEDANRPQNAGGDRRRARFVVVDEAHHLLTSTDR